MPYKTDKIPINNPEKDKRVKLLPEDKEAIKKLYQNGESIHGITRKFKVDKRLIQFVLFPERQKRNLELREKRGGWRQYYSKEKHSQSMKEHRHYKRRILA